MSVGLISSSKAPPAATSTVWNINHDKKIHDAQSSVKDNAWYMHMRPVNITTVCNQNWRHYSGQSQQKYAINQSKPKDMPKWVGLGLLLSAWKT